MRQKNKTIPKLKTSEAQRAAWRAWAERNPEKNQARKNAWAKSPAGRAWLKKNQAKKNAARDAWRLVQHPKKT